MFVSTKLLEGPKRRRGQEKRWVKQFLSSLRQTCSISQSVANLKGAITERRVYQKIKECTIFAAAVKACLESAIDVAMAAAYRRGVHGVDNLIVYKGQPCYLWLDQDGNQVPDGTPGARAIPLTEKKYSDVLLLEILRKKHPDFKEQDKASINLNIQNNNIAIQERFNERLAAYRDAIGRLSDGGSGLPVHTPHADTETTPVPSQ